MLVIAGKRASNLLLYILMLVLGLYLSTYQNYNQYLSAAFNLTGSGMGLLINLHFLGSFTLPLIFGRLSDRFAKKTMLVIAYVIFLSGLIMILATKSSTLLAISILIIGGSFAALEGIGTAILADTNDDSGRIINLSQAFFCGGAAIGPIASEKMFFLTGDYKTVYIAFSVLIACMALASILVIPSKVSKLAEHAQSAKPKLKSGILWLMIFIMVIYVGIEEGYAFWTTTFIHQQTAWPGAGYLALSVYWFAMGIGRLLASRTKSKQLTGTMISVACSIPVVLLLTQVQLSAAVLFLCFALIGFLLSTLWPAVMFQAARAFPTRTGTALGTMMSASALGGAAIPLAVGIVTDLYSVKIAFYLLMILSAGLIVLIMSLHQGLKKKRR